MPRFAVILSLVLAAAFAASCKKKSKRGSSRPSESSQPTGPSPLYPTAERAGTKEIFLLEEPSRGAHITEVEVPSDGDMVLEHALCELEHHGMSCVAGAGNFRMRRSGATEVYELVGAAGVRESYVVERAESGDLAQLAHLDARGSVRWVRTYSLEGAQYSSRELSGGNSLDGCGSMRLDLDEDGRASSATCLQWGGEPMLDASGTAQRVYERDDGGLVARELFRDPEGEALARPDGVHSIVYERGADGSVATTSYFDLEGKPVRSGDGCAARSVRRDKWGREIESQCLDTDGEQRAGIGGVAREKSERNERGCVVQRSFFDADGQAHTPPFRGIVERYEVDEHCAVVAETCHDAGGKPVECDASVARRTSELDASGRTVSRKHFDKKGKPTGSSSLEAHEHRFVYDSLGNATEESCFDKKGEAILCSGTGVHAFVTAYDGAGRAVEVRFLDTDRTATTNLGSAVSRSTYDNYDHLSEVRKEGPSGELTSTRGMSRMRYLYDPGHRLFGILLLEGDGSPADYDACFTGLDCPVTPWHALRVVYEDEDLTWNVIFDRDQRQIGKIDCASAHCLGGE